MSKETISYLSDVDEVDAAKADKINEIQSSLTEITVTLQANTVYKYDTLTSLTISSYETSNYETIIYFKTDTTFIFKLPMDAKQSKNNPDLQPNKEYQMSILNGIFAWGEVITL